MYTYIYIEYVCICQYIYIYIYICMESRYICMCTYIDIGGQAHETEKPHCSQLTQYAHHNSPVADAIMCNVRMALAYCDKLLQYDPDNYLTHLWRIHVKLTTN